LQEFSSGKPHNKIKPDRKNGRCYKKEFGKPCTEKAYGIFNGQAHCKRHYNDAVRMARRYKID
jgi:hypothetical protein